MAIIQFCIENVLLVFAFHADGLRALLHVPAPTDGVKNFKAKKAIDFFFIFWNNRAKRKYCLFHVTQREHETCLKECAY